MSEIDHETRQKNKEKCVQQIDPVIRATIERIRATAARKDGLSGLPSGFHALDKVTSS